MGMIPGWPAGIRAGASGSSMLTRKTAGYPVVGESPLAARKESLTLAIYVCPELYPRESGVVPEVDREK